MSFEDLWQQLLDKDDRTSPAEYPEMVLITRDELHVALVTEREDAALDAFTIVMGTLTAASKERPAEVADALLELSLAVGNIGRRIAKQIATCSISSDFQ